jgi:hypothetical protein
MSEDGTAFESALDAVPELPKRVLTTYVRLWQIETWLRRMVYVELRASYGNNWQQEVAGQRTSKSLAADARLTHMPTPERDPISYATFGDLCQTLEGHWDLFSTYLPPKDLWTAKLQEISQIRNRAAHFRIGHDDDLQRVLQFIRDIDQGFWRFCTSYNDAFPVLPPSRDPVAKRFHHLNQFPYVKVETRAWAMMGIADPEAIINVTINVLQRPWQRNRKPGRIAGQVGLLYDIHIVARDNRYFDYARFLQDTVRLHSSLVHICLDSLESSIRVTIPAVLGTRAVNTLTQRLLDWLPNSLRRGRGPEPSDGVQRLADRWPEYVLGPKNPLCFLAPDMPCSFFAP